MLEVLFKVNSLKEYCRAGGCGLVHVECLQIKNAQPLPLQYSLRELFVNKSVSQYYISVS